MIKILITGGTGYVGGRLIQYLNDSDNFDLTITTRTNHLPIELTQLENVRILILNYDNVDEIIHVLKNQEVIINLGSANEILAGSDPVASLSQSAGNTWKLLEYLDKSSLKLFIQFSTIHVYGSPLPSYIDEATSVNPCHGYSICHLTSEYFVKLLSHKHNFKYLIVRLGNAIGKPLHAEINRWTLLANDLCLQAVRNKKLVLRSTGKQFRNFIALEEVSHFIFGVLDNVNSNNEKYCGTVNLVGTSNMMVLDMAFLIRDRYNYLFGSILPIEISESSITEDSKQVFFSRKKLESWGFHKHFPLEDEIDSMLKFCAMKLNHDN